MERLDMNSTARSLSITAIAVTFLVLMVLGGPFYYLAALIISGVFVGLDLFAGHDVEDPEVKIPMQMNMQLYSVLPMMVIFTVFYAWYISAGDPFHLGAFMKAATGLDMQAARARMTLPEFIVGAYALGTIWAGFGTVVGHELTHRTWSQPAMIVGRWLLALTGDASFAIEHVYGHHMNLGTPKDPATAYRGENVYHFIVRSTIGQIKGAWHIEAGRMKRQGHGVFSWRNRMFSGWLMTLAYAGIFYAASGLRGAAIYFAIMAFGKCYLEAVNFIEHYGIVRVPNEPVEPRHSWNCNHRVSSWLLFNLTRHSHHHAMGDKPYWELRSYPDAPMMPFGYLTMIYLSLIPPLFRKIANPKVLDWDRRFASPSEYRLIEEANRNSNDPDFTGSRAHLAGNLAAAD
ncbi:MAG TPA: alkane 1-monooxygenase [Acetobacteraceae bacterium]|nr:alkane 1-monooxygenase [Acetobacteraceae bacterium]